MTYKGFLIKRHSDIRPASPVYVLQLLQELLGEDKGLEQFVFLINNPGTAVKPKESLILVFSHPVRPLQPGSNPT